MTQNISDGINKSFSPFTFYYFSCFSLAHSHYIEMILNLRSTAVDDDGLLYIMIALSEDEVSYGLSITGALAFIAENISSIPMMEFLSAHITLQRAQRAHFEKSIKIKDIYTFTHTQEKKEEKEA